MVFWRLVHLGNYFCDPPISRTTGAKVWKWRACCCRILDTLLITSDCRQQIKEFWGRKAFGEMLHPPQLRLWLQT